MLISEIKNRSTRVDEIPSSCTGVHESTLRAFQILEKVKHLLENKVSNNIILELIAEMEGGQ